MIRILITDDHSIIQESLANLLAEESDIKVVAAVSSGAEAIKILKSKDIDVLLVDLGMPEMSGFEVLREIQRLSLSVYCIVLSMYEDEPNISKAIQLGVSGYLSKNTEKEELIAAIRTVSLGDTYYGKSVSDTMIAGFSKKRTDHNSSEPRLTKREVEILEKIINGHSNKQIAEFLFLSQRTVDTHRHNIMTKMEVNNTAELVRDALLMNLVQSKGSL